MPVVLCTEAETDGTVTAITVDNGDGTGTRTFFGPDGQETGTEQVDGLLVPQVPEPVVESKPTAPDVLAVLANFGSSLYEIPAGASAATTRDVVRRAAATLLSNLYP